MNDSCKKKPLYFLQHSGLEQYENFDVSYTFEPLGIIENTS